MTASNENVLRIEMKQFGTSLSIRHESKDVFLKIRSTFQFEKYDLIVVDFKGVDTVSSGYAFDLFNQFRTELKDSFLKKIRVSFEPHLEDSIVRSVVKGAFNATMKGGKL